MKTMLGCSAAATATGDCAGISSRSGRITTVVQRACGLLMAYLLRWCVLGGWPWSRDADAMARPGASVSRADDASALHADQGDPPLAPREIPIRMQFLARQDHAVPERRTG